MRDYLFKNKSSHICGICVRDYPIEFLVCSHIKKRSECTEIEKMDFKNIVMPMCVFGCDKLYENGHVGVSNGRVIILRNHSFRSVKEYIDKIRNKQCPHWTKENEKYFRWHNSYFNNDKEILPHKISCPPIKVCN